MALLKAKLMFVGSKYTFRRIIGHHQVNVPKFTDMTMLNLSLLYTAFLLEKCSMMCHP